MALKLSVVILGAGTQQELELVDFSKLSTHPSFTMAQARFSLN
jgi:hypothetical protein